MQRFKCKKDVKIGTNIIFNNVTKYCHDLPKVNLVGKVIAVEDEGDKILIDLYIAGRQEPTQVKLPYYILQ